MKGSSVPLFDLEKEYLLQQTVLSLIKLGCIESAHDISDGGLFITLIESCLQNNLGFDIVTFSDIREDSFLFGESPSRIIVSVLETKEDHFLDELSKHNTPFTLIGHVTKGEIRIDDESFGFIEEYKELYNNSLGEYLK